MTRGFLNGVKGFGMVEAIVAVSIAAAFILALVGVNNLYLRIALADDSKLQSAFLAEEGLEAVRFLRDDSWTEHISPLATGFDYYLYWSGSEWEPTTTPVYVGIFDRRVRFDPVYRDPSDNIAISGTLDPDTLQVTATVSWAERGATSSRAVSSYITNLFDN